MSLSGSTSESYAKTGDGMLRVNEAQGPEPTPENPAGVFPQTSGGPAPGGSMPGAGPPSDGGDARTIFGNPQVFKDMTNNLSSALTSALNTLHEESPSGLGSKAKALEKRLKEIRDEIEGWQKGQGLGVEEKNDEVDREGSGAGGLYND